MRWKVLVSAPYMQPVVERFRPFFVENSIEIVVPKVRERLEEEELLELIADIDGVICGDDRFTKKVLKKAKKLKVVAKWGTGIDSIDQEEAAKLNIAVCNTQNAFSDPVADSVLGYILSFARQIPWVTRDMQSGKWQKRGGVALAERSLGIIGVGNIGKAVVRRAVSFGMKVLGTDIAKVDPVFAQETGIEMVAKDDLLKNADFVSLNCDLNLTSLHLIGPLEFSLMKPEAFLINTARGPIVNEKALIKALQEGKIAGAALDVFEDEPLVKDSPLRKMDNCLLAPHNANSSPRAWDLVHKNTLNNLVRELKARSK
ncbi:MAG: dihydrofolate reductase [Candidatus Saganbacteria bacterium]|nr:dihydrofolate reductase [Candidatus Saganbacteria bacterium]